MNVFEVATLYKGYVDEDSAEWHEDVFPIYLKLAYEDFRKAVTQINSWVYATEVDIDITGLDYDLASAAVTILGPAPTNTKMSRLLEVWAVTGGRVRYPLEAALGPREQYNNCAYRLQGTVLKFTALVEQKLRLYYLPQSTVDWTKVTAVDDEFIDNFDEYHELIAVYAAIRYGVRDGGMPRVLELKRQKELELEEHITHFFGEAGSVIRSTADTFNTYG